MYRIIVLNCTSKDVKRKEIKKKIEKDNPTLKLSIVFKNSKRIKDLEKYVLELMNDALKVYIIKDKKIKGLNNLFGIYYLDPTKY